MDSDEKIVRHLEMTQSVVERMARNSFLLKGWAVTLVAASLWLIVRGGMSGFSAGLLIFMLVAPFGGWTAISCGKSGCSRNSMTPSGPPRKRTFPWTLGDLPGRSRMCGEPALAIRRRMCCSGFTRRCLRWG